ncbi:hypothetical protein ACFLU5_08860 [Bacteroidota bacterium]
MSKVIIAIHGLGNKPPSAQLESWWKQSMLEGLKLIKKKIDLPEFRFIYWADVIYDKPLDDHISDKEDPLYLDEPYTPSPENFIPEPQPVRKKVLDFIEEQLDRIFLNEDLTVNFSGISDMIIHNYFKELEIYYSENCVDVNDASCQARETIRKRVADVIRGYKNDQIMLIGHSMGSIIAYDVLTYVVPEIEIDTFITVGAPLAMPVIIGKIASASNKAYTSDSKLKTPPGVKWRWYNFSDLQDKVALIYNLGKKFKRNTRRVKPEDYVVYNNYIINGAKNHHKSFGYLRTPEFSRVLSRFARRKKMRTYDRIILNIKSFIRKIKNQIKY